MSSSQSTLQQVWANPLYRGATIALFLSGLGASSATPYIASYLVNDLGASLTVAGLYYLTTLTAPVAGYLVGSRSDRTGDRLGLFRLCALAGFIGWTLIALANQLWMPFVINAIVLGFAGGATSQLFAAIHDEIKAHPGDSEDGIISTVRMSLTAGWIIGPVLGTMVADQFGYRVLLFGTALCLLAQIAPLGTLKGQPQTQPLTTHTGTGAHEPGPDLTAMKPLLIFTMFYLFVYAGESVKYGYLPIYMTDDLHLSSTIKGAVIGIQPLVELILMPVAVIVARRTGMLNLMAVAAMFGVAANLFFATAESAFGLFAGQILMGGVWGVFAALGIIVAQRLLPQAVATASAIFMSSTALALATGGLTGGLGVAAIGLPHVFLIPAGFALAAVVGIIIFGRSLPARL